MTDDEFRDLLLRSREGLLRLKEEAATGRFAVGDNPNTRTPDDIAAQVGRFQYALEDVERALKRFVGVDVNKL